MPETREIDTIALAEIKDYCRQLEANAAQRNADYTEYESMYLLDWKSKDDPRLANQRVTLDTTPRQAIEGMTRLMISNDPVWKIDQDRFPDSERIEKELAAWWNGSSRAARQPHQYDLVRAGILYGAMEAAITPTQELLEYARQGKNKATIAEAERLADRTPFLIDVWNPRSGYPAFDAFGLAAYYRKVELPLAEIESRYGPLPEELKKNGRWKNQTLHTYWDREYHAVWLDQHTITCRKHNLPLIPITSQNVDGSMLFAKPEYQRQPPLYAILRAGLWDSTNVYLTTAFTTVLAMGAVGKWIHVSPPGMPGKTLAKAIDWDSFAIELEAGEQLTPLISKGLLDPDAASLYATATQMMEGNTIFKQALGSPMNRDATFSEISLLSQQGRLPLIASQRKGGWGMGEIAEKMLTWAREKPAYLKTSQLKKGDIPKAIEVLCSLEVGLPQDVLQNANIARLLSQGDDPLTSKEWALENVMHISQPQREMTRIWDERANQMRAMQEIQRLLQEAEAEAQARKMAQQNPQFPGAGPMPGQPPMPGGPPPAGMPGQPPSAPPQAGPMMGAPDQAQAIQGGLPPQMAGIMPGMGQGAMPPELPGEGGMPNA